MMRSISAGVPVNKELIKTVYDKILITKQEIAALQEAKAAQDELSASTLKHHEILSIPTPSEITGGIHPLTQANLEVAKQVRQNFEDMYTGSQNMLYDLGLMEFETFAEDLEKLQSTKLQSISALSQQTATLVGAFGKKAFALQKGVGIANATVSAYEAYNKNLAAFPFPFGPIMAALALATGLAQVAKIVALQPGGIAHGGLTNVPRESTFLLDRGERVLSPEQNRDLTEFLKAGGASINLDLTINTDQPLDRVDWDSLVEDDILPALTKLDKAGIKI
jgi:hypothetical protein